MSQWYDKVEFAPLCAAKRTQVEDCDEYPPFATTQGGEFNRPLPSLRAIDASHNQASGGTFGRFYGDNGYGQCARAVAGEGFLVIPVRAASAFPVSSSVSVLLSQVGSFWLGCE